MIMDITQPRPIQRYDHRPDTTSPSLPPAKNIRSYVACIVSNNLLWSLLCYGCLSSFLLRSAIWSRSDDQTKLAERRGSDHVYCTWLVVVVTTDCSPPDDWQTPRRQLLYSCCCCCCYCCLGQRPVCHERSLWQRVQDHLQRIGCHDVQWRISCAEDLKSL